jgi:hypothetical protein
MSWSAFFAGTATAEVLSSILPVRGRGISLLRGAAVGQGGYRSEQIGSVDDLADRFHAYPGGRSWRPSGALVAH